MLSNSHYVQDGVDEVDTIYVKLSKLFSIGEYQNELETLRKLQKMPAQYVRLYRQLILSWLNSEESYMEKRRATLYASSLSFKKKGNELFQAAEKQTAEDTNIEGWLAAARMYTSAIMDAPPKSELLAMSHANRAMALLKSGYYKQAYDDTVCALENGSYPERLRHKVWLRQAHCAWHLGSASLLGANLDDLAHVKMNASFCKEVEELRRKQHILMQSDEISKVDTIKLPKDTDMHRDSQKILETTRLGRKSLAMVATRAFKKGELIFSERVSSFVPINGNHVCQECAATLLIPFPCTDCSRSVVYCSLTCRNKHHPIHAYECMAYQKYVIDRIGIGHLALRVMLDGLMLSNILPYLRQFSSAKEIWSELVEDGGSVRKYAPIYAESLRMVTNLDKMAENDIQTFTILATLVTTYLKEFTTFFDQVKGAAATISDWELVAASLILRHIAQLTCNAHTSMSLVPLNHSGNSPLLTTNFWKAPFRVKRGYLHLLDNIEPIAAMNLPYFSICNHSCEQFVQPKYSGRYVHVYACQAIEANAEIFNSYTLDCRKSKWTQRNAILKNNYKFDCVCVPCQQSNPDEQYEKFHKYWCGNCRSYFTIKSQRETHNWWQPGFGLLGNVSSLNCCYCKKSLDLGWAYEIFENIKKQTHKFEDRMRLYNGFCRVEKWLVYYHTLRLLFASRIASVYFEDHISGLLQPDEYPRLVHLLKLCLDGIVEQGQKISIEYAAQMTYLWDLIATGKYKCDKAEMAGLLTPLEAISDEHKEMFMNYYDDYIKSLLE